MAIRHYETDAIIPPGESLAEELEVRGLTPREFAKQLRMSTRVLMALLLGEKPLTAEIALDLERTLGISAVTWVNLEAMYRLALAKRNRAKSA